MKKIISYLAAGTLLMAATIPALPAMADVPTSATIQEMLTVTPATGAPVTSVEDLAQFTLSLDAESEYNFVNASMPALNKIYLQKVGEDNTTSNILSYKKGVISSDKKSITYDIDGDLKSKNLEAGTYRINFTKASNFQIFGGALTSRIGNPAGMTYEYTYAPDASASVNITTLPAKGAMTLTSDFEGITINFEGGTATVNEEVAVDGAIKATVNGEEFNGFTMNGTNKFGILRTTQTPEGIVTFTLPAGFYNLTLEDGSVVPSREISTHFYIGEFISATIPAAGARIPLEGFNEFEIVFPAGFAATAGELSIRKGITIQVGRKAQSYGEDFYAAPESARIMELDLEEHPITIGGDTETTLIFPEGAYILEKDGYKFTSPETETVFTLTTDKLSETEVKYTTIPAEGGKSEGLKEFSVTFEGVKSVIPAAGADAAMAERAVTLTYGDKKLYNGFGFDIEEGSNDFTKFILTEAIEVNEATAATVSIKEGAYALTLEDGSTVKSPAVEFTFTIESTTPEVAYTTVPANGTNVAELEQFEVNFEGVKEYAWKNSDALPGITLTYGETTMTYADGFTEGDDLNIMLLDEALTFAKATDVTVTFPAGLYTLTMENGTTLDSPEVTFTFSVGEVQATDNGKWVAVNSLDELNAAEGVECVFAWYYNGEKTAQEAPAKRGAQQAPPINYGEEACIVMNNTVAGNERTPYLAATSVEKGNFTTQDGLRIAEMPIDAAIIRIVKTENGYTLYDTTAEPAGYLAPGTDLTSNLQMLQVLDQPYENSISISADGAASVRSTYRTEDANVLSAIVDWGFTGNSQTIFKYAHQALNIGNLYILRRAVAADELILNATPANNETVAPTEDGKQNVTFKFGEFENATRNAEAEAVTATFNGEALGADAIVMSQTYPVEATFALPANTDGKLVVSIPAGWYNVEVEGNSLPTPAFTYTLNISHNVGVDAMLQDMESSNVYTLEGVCVIRDAKAADLKLLAPGVYVQKGKVFIVK